MFHKTLNTPRWDAIEVEEDETSKRRARSEEEGRRNQAIVSLAARK